jgi:diguanylate cyclase (GGDEF)-like protein
VSGLRRPLLYLVVAIAVVTGALLYAFQLQRHAAVSAAGRTDSAVLSLTAMLDQETGVRGFLYTGQEDFLQPYINGQTNYETERLLVNVAAAGDPASMRLAAAEDTAARAWQAYAVTVIDARRESATPPADAADQTAYGKKQMDAFRADNSALRTRLDQRRDAALHRSGIVWTVTVSGLALLFALIGFGALHRGSRRALDRSEREVAYRGRQSEFSDLIQAVDSKDEAHELVQRHLERSLVGASVTVLERNNSDNRLQAATLLPADSVLAEHLISAEPRACLAIRLGRTHQEGGKRDELISCTICSHVAGTAMCQPLLVGGKVIGAVLIERGSALGETERRGVTDTVAQAAPVLANLRTIAIAENRASTDALTGLPNRRAMSDTLRRMSAHAGRTGRPLAAIAFDLDGFKAINDRYGHEIGDAALSAVGECLHECLRESDFAARTGGEEFLVLAPDTDPEGARILAEKLRAALSREEVPSLLEPVTASFGVAVMPDHAISSEALLRQADRACYLAKERGRDRVELAGTDETVIHAVRS